MGLCGKPIVQDQIFKAFLDFDFFQYFEFRTNGRTE